MEGHIPSVDGGGQDGQGQIGEPTEASTSSGRGEQGASNNSIKSHNATTAGTANTECSTDSAKTVTTQPGLAMQVTWRGQPVPLAGPIVITLRESLVRKFPCGRRGRHGKPCIDGTEAVAGDSEYDLPSSEEGSDARLASDRNRRQSKGGQHVTTQGRDGDGKRRGPTESCSSKRGSSARRNSARFNPPSDTEAKKECHADRKNFSQCRQAEALPLDQVGSSAPTLPRGCQGHGSGAPSLLRPAVFLADPYAGPPVAECPRAWPAREREMADPTEGYRRRHHGARHKSGSCISRGARRKIRRAGKRTKKRSSERTRYGSDSSSTSSGSSTDSETFAREDKTGDGPRAESKKGHH